MTSWEGYGNISGKSDDGGLTQKGAVAMREEVRVRCVLKAKLTYFPSIRHRA